MVVETPSSTLEAGILVAADGLMSSLRRAAGLERTSHAPRRFGLRQHFRVEPWSRSVEVHLSSGAEAYVTPAGNGRIGVAFLWEEGQATQPVSVRMMLRRFPALESKLRSADADSAPIGAGPLARRATGLISDRFALLGDAAGYVDAITGEGLSLAFSAAATLGALLPQALRQGATRESLLPYESDCARRFRHYAIVAHSVLALARRPALRRYLLHQLAAHPRAFERLVAWGSL
jgi:flavin-dependent dehydrogenase